MARTYCQKELSGGGALEVKEKNQSVLEYAKAQFQKLQNSTADDLLAHLNVTTELKSVRVGPGKIKAGTEKLNYTERAQHVLGWQTLLTQLAKDLNQPNLDPQGIDGKFGKNTKSAVKNFQKLYNSKTTKEKIAEDGLPGPDTLKAAEFVQRHKMKFANIQIDGKEYKLFIPSAYIIDGTSYDVKIIDSEPKIDFKGLKISVLNAEKNPKKGSDITSEIKNKMPTEEKTYNFNNKNFTTSPSGETSKTIFLGGKDIPVLKYDQNSNTFTYKTEAEIYQEHQTLIDRL